MNIVNPTNVFSSPHPGAVLKGELEENGLSQRELAAALGKSAPMINGILNGNKDITVEIAILLEAALPKSLSAQDWLRLQNEFDLESKRKESSLITRASAIRIWNFLRQNSNFNALRRRLNFGSNFEENIGLVMKTLGIANLQELEKALERSQVGFKKSEKVQTDMHNLFSWIIIVKHASQEQTLNASYDSRMLPQLKNQLNQVFFDNIDVVDRTRHLLNTYGIKFITDEKQLDKVPVDGYSFWRGENPTIVATQRMNRIDNFAFTIMHELGHIERHLEQNGTEEFIDADKNVCGEINQQEREANEYATDAIWGGMLPEELFADIANPYGASKHLKRISQQYKVNVGIVTGQYQHYCDEKGLVRNSYAICRELISKIG